MITQTTVRHTTVYLVRHGESLLNREKRVSGQLDTSLSSNGIQKGQLLADRLRHVALTGIYTSALTRTIETARPTAEHHGLPIQRTPELNELHMGVLEGRFRDTRDPEASAIWQEHKKDKRHYRIPGGECFLDLAKRVKASFDDILARENGGVILIVGHRNVNRALFRLLMHLPEIGWPDLALKSRYVYQIMTGKQPRMNMVRLMAQTEDGARTQAMV